MGLTHKDLVPEAPKDVPEHVRSEASEMMDAYEAHLACQLHKCFVCKRADDLRVPVWDVNNVLAGFACEACRPYVEE